MNVRSLIWLKLRDLLDVARIVGLKSTLDVFAGFETKSMVDIF